MNLWYRFYSDNCGNYLTNLAFFFFFKSAAWSKQIGSWEEKMDKKGEKEGQIGPSEDEWHPCQSLTTPKPTA